MSDILSDVGGFAKGFKSALHVALNGSDGSIGGVELGRREAGLGEQPAQCDFGLDCRVLAPQAPQPPKLEFRLDLGKLAFDLQQTHARCSQLGRVNTVIALPRIAALIRPKVHLKIIDL